MYFLLPLPQDQTLLQKKHTVVKISTSLESTVSLLHRVQQKNVFIFPRKFLWTLSRNLSPKGILFFHSLLSCSSLYRTSKSIREFAQLASMASHSFFYFSSFTSQHYEDWTTFGSISLISH
jgi:hypothetical protein